MSNWFSTVLTVGHSLHWFPGLDLPHQGEPVHIHLIGADIPEVAAVQSGLIQVRDSSNDIAFKAYQSMGLSDSGKFIE